MSNMKISKEEQEKLRKDAKKELERIEKLMSDSNVVSEIDKLKDKFSICENVYKVILKEHKFRKAKRYYDYFEITMKEVPHAMNFAGYNFDRTFLGKIFGSEKKKGIRSIKTIRNSLTHEMNQSVINELMNRKDELNKYMDEFLENIRSAA